MIKIKTRKQLEKAINTIIRQIPRAMKNSLNDARNYAVSVVPVKTGRLKGSIKVEEINPFYGRIGTNVEYARVVEFGDVGRRPKPYLRPAFVIGQKSLKRRLKQIIRKAVT